MLSLWEDWNQCRPQITGIALANLLACIVASHEFTSPLFSKLDLDSCSNRCPCSVLFCLISGMICFFFFRLSRQLIGCTQVQPFTDFLRLTPLFWNFQKDSIWTRQARQKTSSLATHVDITSFQRVEFNAIVVLTTRTSHKYSSRKPISKKIRTRCLLLPDGLYIYFR